MDVRSTDRTDLTKRLEPPAKPAGKADGEASRRHNAPKDERVERDPELETMPSPDGSHILDVKV